MSDDDEQVDVLRSSPVQPAVSDALLASASDVRVSLSNAVDTLRALPAFEDECSKAVWTWHLTISTLCWDVSEVAVFTAGVSPSLRAARILTRSIFEYATRVHYYIFYPDEALKHAEETHNMLRRVMKPLKGADDENLSTVQDLLNSGGTKANQPKSEVMIAALVRSFMNGHDGSKFVAWLSAEYALSTAYAHGSQTVALDILDADGSVNRRSLSLGRRQEFIRCVLSMLALLAGLEAHYSLDFHVTQHIADLQELGPWTGTTSMARHVGLIHLFGLS